MSSGWCLIAYCKALTQQTGRIITVEPEVTSDSTMAFSSLPVLVAVKEHIKSRAATGWLPLASSPPKLFLRQPEHKWNLFSLLPFGCVMQPSTL